MDLEGTHTWIRFVGLGRGDFIAPFFVRVEVIREVVGTDMVGEICCW